MSFPRSVDRESRDVYHFTFLDTRLRGYDAHGKPEVS
jgi:hypothetical protein